MKEILINDPKSKITYKLMPVKAEESDFEDFDEIEEAYPDLAKSIVAFGGSCIAFYAVDERGHRYLVKRFTNDQGGERSSEIIKKIIAKHDKLGINYFLDDCFTGSDGETTYHVFARINGATPVCQYPKNVEKLLNVLLEYKSFLESLKILHNIGYVHFDIKPENIFRFKANASDTNSMQILDFGSCVEAEEIISTIRQLGKRGYRYSSTLKWYNKDDIDALCTFVTNGIEGLEYVLDLTAAVKVLCYLICGKSDGFSFENLGIDKYSGICSKLHEMYFKATSTDLTRRYVLCEEIIRDVDLLIGAINGKFKYSDSLRIISKNTITECNEKICQDKLITDLKNEYYKENKSQGIVDINDLLNQISTDILPNIFVEDAVYSYGTHTNALERIINTYSGNIALFGTGGGGKSTALKHLYLSNIVKKTKHIYLYLSAKDFELENIGVGNKRITAILNARYKNCEIEELLLSKSDKIIILFDALDEISSENDAFVYREIEELSKYNNRFVITSREDKSKRKNLINAVQGEFLSLTDEQIERAVPFIESLKKYPIYKLLKTPMLLTIFKKLEALGDYRKTVRYPEELIEEYLKKIYTTHNESNVLFDKLIRDTSCYCVCSIDRNDYTQHKEATEFFKREHLDHIISSALHFKPFYDNGGSDSQGGIYKMVFAHKLYEDYFKGRWLYDFFVRTMKKDYIEVNDFFFEEEADIEKNFSPYWAKRLKKRLLEDEGEADIYKVLNDFISRFKRRDVRKKITGYGLYEKRYKAIKHIIQMIVYCCDGELVDVFKNKPLVNLKSFHRHFSSVANYEEVKSIYLPWYVNIYFHVGFMDYNYESSADSSIESYDKSTEKENSGHYNADIWSKNIVVSKWNLSCKSKNGSIYSKLGTKLICATQANAENNCFEIPKHVISIENEAFRHCNCKSIKSRSIFFYDKDGVLYKRFPKALVRYPIKKEDMSFKVTEAKRVLPYAFAYTERLRQLDMSNVTQKILPKSMVEGSVVEWISLPPKALIIGERSFCGCESLKNITIPKSVRAIFYKSFYGCRNITEFITGDKIRFIGMRAAASTSNLKRLWIGDGCLYTSSDAFEDSGARKQTHPSGRETNTLYPDLKIIRYDPYDYSPNLFNSVHHFDHGNYSRFFRKTKRAYKKRQAYSVVCNLAICYEEGIGVKKDIKKAYDLYNSMWYYEDEFVLTKLDKLKKLV